VKAYDNETALPLIAPMLGPDTSILTLQNGVDSVAELAARYGERPIIGGTTYVAAAIVEPGVIEQTGTHRRIVMGEVFGDPPRLSDRVRAIGDALTSGDIEVETVDDCRVPIWEKFILLVSAAAFTGAARLPIGPLWADEDIRARLLDGCREIEAVARAEGVPVAPDMIGRVRAYMTNIPPTMRSSLLIDLSMGKRIEVEALQGAVVRRAARAGVPVPVISTLYAVLKPWAQPAG
jgi:2-dehydropantoate 2-reductase